MGDRPTILRAPDLGIAAEIADQNDLVHRACHDNFSCFADTVSSSCDPASAFKLFHRAQRRRARILLWAKRYVRCLFYQKTNLAARGQARLPA
jgi:hypothetical protein